MERTFPTKNWAVAAVTVAIVILSEAFALGADPLPNYYVLAVGVSKYQDKRLANISSCAKDAQAIVDLFKGQGTDTKSKLLLNENATSANIKAALAEMATEVRKGDLVVVFMSGHGDRVRGSWNFCPHDFGSDPLSLSRFDGFDASASHTVTSFDVIHAVQDLRARGHHVLLALNTCHAGQIRHSPDWGFWIAKQPAAAGGLILLASSVPSETSMGAMGDNLSVFTQALMEALKGKGKADGDSLVTLKQVRSYLIWRMKELVSRRSKLPGLPFPEQDCLCDWEQSIPETLPLAKAADARMKPGGDPFVSPIKLFGSEADISLAKNKTPLYGRWRFEVELVTNDGKPAIGKDGKPLRKIYELVLRSDSLYRAVLHDSDQPDMPEMDFVGRWGISPMFKHVSLDYGNGEDTLSFESVPDKEMTVLVEPYPNDRPVAKWKLKRQ